MRNTLCDSYTVCFLAVAIFETGCAAQQEASDPMLQREDSEVHGEVGVAYGQGTIRTH